MIKISLYPYFFLKFFVFFKITIYLYIKKDNTMDVIGIILMAVGVIGVIGAIATSHVLGAMLFAKLEKHYKKKEEE